MALDASGFTWTGMDVRLCRFISYRAVDLDILYVDGVVALGTLAYFIYVSECIYHYRFFW